MLINNAGFGSCGKFLELDLDRELEMTDLNIRAMLELSHRFAKAMVQKGSGKILIVASCGGFQPGPGMNTYFATKAFDLHFAEALDEELLGTGVRCSVLCPGPTATEFFDVAGAKSLKATPMPSMNVKDVVAYTIQKMDQGQRIIIPGGLNKLASFCYRFFSKTLNHKHFRKSFIASQQIKIKGFSRTLDDIVKSLIIGMNPRDPKGNLTCKY